MDARIEATRRQLRDAVLRLAAEKDVNAITVAELARAADIDRSTFYAHASSPARLLEAVLSEDLDPLRFEVDEALDDDPAALATLGAQLNARLIDHVERYEAVYADRAGGRPSSALHSVLSGHVQTSLQLVFQHLEEMGGGSTEPKRPERPEPAYLAAFIAHGLVGAIAVWLGEPAPRDRRRLEEVLDVVYATWLLPGLPGGPGGDGLREQLGASAASGGPETAAR